MIFNVGGQLIADNGGIVVHASSSIRNGGWLQSMGDIQMITPMLENTKGIILSKNGGIIIQSDQNGHGLGFLNNNSGIIQSAKDLTLYTQSLENENGKILTFPALGNGTIGNIVLYADAQGQALTTLHLSNNGVIQSSGDVTFRAQSSGLSSTGTIIASQNLRAVLDGDLNNNNILFTSLGKTTSQSLSDNQNPGVNLTVNGNYTINEDGGITSGGDLMLTANQITNNGVLIALNNMALNATRLTNNVKGLLSSSNNMVLTINGNLDNFGVLQADQGSMTIQAIGDITNIWGLIRTQSANGDITLTANSFTNKYSGTLIEQKINSKTVYDTAVNAVGQPYDGISNKDFTKNYADEGTWKSSDLSQYFYNSDVKILQINTPKGMYTTDGKPASGYFYMFLSGGNNKANTRVEITATGTQTILNGTAAIISAGRDLALHTTGNITNDVSHIEAGRNMDLQGASLNNVGHQNDAVYKLACYNPEFCRYLYPKDNRNNPLPNYTIDGSYEGDKNKIILDGHSMISPPMHIWGSNTVNRGLSGTAAGNLLGQFTGQVNNTTIIEHALPSDFTQSNPILPSGKLPTTEQGENGQKGMKGPGESPLEEKTSQVTAINEQDPTLPAYSGVTNPQGIDPGLHVTLPGFNGGGSTNVSDILSSITGGQALFRPNPNVTGGNSSLNGIAGEGITGNPSIPDSAKPSNNMNGNHEIAVNNTAAVQPGSNYLIETRPQYTSVKQLYGSQYLLDRLNIHGSYMFLGDSGFDSQYIQQQYIQATGQSYSGGTYRTASDALKTLLDNAASQSGKLGLQFGEALTTEQQAALDEDIVWYVPQIVDGKTVLVPQLYLSPKTAVLSGGSIKGKDVRLTAGSINNSGLMEGTHSIGLTATNGNIANIGGTIKGGDVSLVARDGSVINSDTVNHYLVDGGHASYLGSQGQIMASGTLGMQASDSITTHGGLIQSGSDLALSAGTINIGAAELDASASSITHASDGKLSFTGNQTKHYGTTIISGGNTALQTTSGDMALSGSNLFSGGNVSLNSKGKIGLNTVTDSGMTDLKGHKSGAFTSSAFENRNSYEKQVGSSIISGGSLSALAQKDVDISGRLSGVQDVTVASKAGSIIEHALTFKQDDYDYHHTEKTGFFGNETGLSAQVGTKKVSDKNTSSSELHSGSLISSTKGSVVLDAGQDININASNVLEKKDINMAGNTINLNTVKDSTKGDQFHKDSFTGLAVTATGIVSDAARAGFDAANAQASDMQALNAANIGYAGLATGMGKAGYLRKEDSKTADYNLMGASATIGHSSNKSHATETTTTDVGSTVMAGGKVNITAKKEINATASTISGNDIIFNAGGDINLNAGYRTTQTKVTASSNSFGVGGGTSLGVGGGSFFLKGDVSVGHGKTTTSSKTAIDSVVNGVNSVVINNHDGNLTLNGAQIVNRTPDAKGSIVNGVASNGSITIDTGNLTVTTPQNTSKYDNNTKVLGVSATSSIGGGFGLSSSPPEVPYT